MSLERLLGIFVKRRSLQSTVVASLYVDCGVNHGLISHTQSWGHSLLCYKDRGSFKVRIAYTQDGNYCSEAFLAEKARGDFALT